MFLCTQLRCFVYKHQLPVWSVKGIAIMEMQSQPAMPVPSC